MTSITLASIEADLRHPFPPHDVKLLPKAPTKNDAGQWTCLALPYADKRSYEDRLNVLAFGHWSTPYTTPLVAGNKLVIPVTVVLCGVEHTDYGESFLASTSQQGRLREEENSATEAYSQGFRRACAQFGLGRYFYELPTLRLPYDPQARKIALSHASERIAWVEKLYLQAGLLPKKERPERCSSTSAPVSSHEQGEENAAIGPRELAWVRRQLNDDPNRIARVCTHYRIANLEELTSKHYLHFFNKMAQQSKPAGSTGQKSA